MAMTLQKKPAARLCAATIVLAASTSVSYAGAPSLMNSTVASPSAHVVEAQYCCGDAAAVASVTELRPVVHWRARTVWRPTTVWRPVRSYQPVRSWRPVTHHYYYAPVYYAPTYYVPANSCCYSGYSGY